MANTTIAERALLVKLSLSTWTGRYKDKTESETVCITNRANMDAAGVWLYSVDKPLLAPVITAAGVVRSEFCRGTLPWQDGGYRIAASDLYMAWTGRVRSAIDGFKLAVTDFLRDYPAATSESIIRQRFGNLADSVLCRLPHVSELAGKFSVYVDVLPMPSENDFRVSMADSDLIEIKKRTTETIERSVGNAMGELWNQFSELVSKIGGAMGQPDKIFRDSLITNLRDFVELIPKMNLTNNAQLETLRQTAAAQLAALNPAELRAVPTARQTAAANANDLLAKIREYRQ